MEPDRTLALLQDRFVVFFAEDGDGDGDGLQRTKSEFADAHESSVVLTLIICEIISCKKLRKRKKEEKEKPQEVFDRFYIFSSTSARSSPSFIASTTRLSCPSSESRSSTPGSSW